MKNKSEKYISINKLAVELFKGTKPMDGRELEVLKNSFRKSLKKNAYSAK